MPGSRLQERPQDSVALSAYRARMSRLRIRYAAAVAVVVVLALIGVWLLWLTGEAHNATLRTATSGEPAVADTGLAPALHDAWSSTDVTATGSYSSRGTVVTSSAHTVRGRDALTGAVRWSYTRSDVTVCGVDTQDGVAVAIFRLDGNCDEVIGLSISTGARLWNRTLMDNGESTMQSRPGSVAITTSTSVHVISPVAEANEPSGGLDRWLYRPAGCTVESSVLGSGGVLVATQCAAADASSAGDQTGAAGSTQPKLVLRKPNDDGDVWSVDGDAAIPVLAESALVLGWDAGSHQLIALDAAKGSRIAALNLPNCVVDSAPRAMALGSSSGSDALLYCGQTLSRVSLQGTALSVRWSVAAVGLPAAQTNPEQSSSTAVMPTSTGFATIDIATGAPTGASATVPADALAAIAQAQRVERFGAGMLVAGTATLMLQPPG